MSKHDISFPTPSTCDNILRAMFETSSEKFRAALQILDLVTAMVADRLKAPVCLTLYRRSGDNAFRILAIEDTLCFDTALLPTLEKYANSNFGADTQNCGEYLDLADPALQGTSDIDFLVAAGVSHVYAARTGAENGDQALLVSFLSEKTRTQTLSAARVCAMAGEQLRVVFSFVETELRQARLGDFIKIILRLSSVRFAGREIGETLERIVKYGISLPGVLRMDIRGPEGEGYADYCKRLEDTNSSGVGNDSGLGETIVRMLNEQRHLLEPDGCAVFSLSQGEEAPFVALFVPRPGVEFGEDYLRLMSVYCAYSAITILNHTLTIKQRRANDILRGAQRRLVEAETLAKVGDMASGVAHDFNNTLGGILGRAQLLQLKATDPAVQKQLGLIEEAARAGAARIKRLQEYAIAVKPADLLPFDLAVTFHAYAKETREWNEAAQSKGVRVSFQAKAGLSVIINGRPDDIPALLDNLLRNAVEASLVNGEVAIELQVENDRATIQVRDSGPGIPDTIKNKIFNPFFTTKKEQGAGLGLSVAHGLAVRHGGGISAQSAHDKIGATFTITFPLAGAKESAAAAPHETSTPDAPSSETPSPETTAALRVMVVDDDNQIRDILGDMLGLWDLTPDTFPDGPSALLAYEQGKYDLVITDLGMPGMSGLELTGEIRKKDPTAVVALLTGWGAQLEPAEVHAKGIFRILSKPFHISEIHTLIQSVPRRA